MNRAATFTLCFGFLVVILFLCYAAAFYVTRGPETDDVGREPTRIGRLVLFLLAACALEGVVVAYLITKSSWFGWSLVLVIFSEMFGLGTLMAQVEAAVFIRQIRAGTASRFVAAGAIKSGMFAPLAVSILGKMHSSGGQVRGGPTLSVDPKRWLGGLAILIITYLTLYVVCGYFIALRSEAVRRFYDLQRAETILQQASIMIRTTPGLVALQVLRSLLWIVLALPIALMLRGAQWETALAMGVTFSVLMSAQLLLPNPYMPRAVRLVHFVEISAENFIMGIVTAFVLRESGIVCR